MCVCCGQTHWLHLLFSDRAAGAEPGEQQVRGQFGDMATPRTRRGDVYRPLTLTERGRRQAAIATVGDTA